VVRLRQPSRSLVFRVLRIGAALLGCSFFLLSMILPFHFLDIPGMSFPVHSEYSTYYWSFRLLNRRVSFPTELPTDSRIYAPPIWTDNWFLDCWFHDNFINRLSLSNILITLFALQILTLITGIVSLFVKKSFFALVPTTLCFTVIWFMNYTCATFSFITDASDVRQLGYWLAYPSMLMFLFSFVASIVSKYQISIFKKRHN
jgi:hypothetical protein